MAVYYAFAMGA